jgi:hypothetical protein
MRFASSPGSRIRATTLPGCMWSPNVRATLPLLAAALAIEIVRGFAIGGRSASSRHRSSTETQRVSSAVEPQLRRELISGNQDAKTAV